EGEHAVEPQRHAAPPLLVAMNQDLGVGMVAAEHVSVADQFGAQLGVIVDFPVEDDAYGCVLVPHRLRAGGDVDHRQPPVAEKYTRVGRVIEAFTVGTAMRERSSHCLQVSKRAVSHKSRDSAHLLSPDQKLTRSRME